MRVRRHSLVVLALVTGAWLIGATSASATVTCVYQERGAVGNADNRLLINATSFAEAVALARDGDEIDVTNDATITQVICSGPQTPTVNNLDKIKVNAAEETSFYADLAFGPFAPGATSEAGGGSEIEFKFNWLGGFPGIGGTSGIDHFEFGQAGGQTAANLNGPLELAQDIDMKLGDHLGGILVRGRGGSDVISGAESVTFANDLRGGPLNAFGGTGKDYLTGGRREDYLEGEGGGDVVRGGKGEDTFKGGQGRDRLKARDGHKDHVSCGPGEDRASGDAEDAFHGCEHISLP